MMKYKLTEVEVGNVHFLVDLGEFLPTVLDYSLDHMRERLREMLSKMESKVSAADSIQ